MSSSLIGRTLGKYKVTELLGQGGMATVYKGYQEDIDRFVAIKVLPPHPGLDREFIERFRLEARTIARLQHPHILPLYDYDSQDDILFLATAYMDGGSLADLIDKGPLRLDTAETILRQIASALNYAHRQGVIHRDIKPGNILLDSEGHALLADFGIVKVIAGGSNLTGTGMIGTPAYMAPEQVESGTVVDARADLYALGIVVYEMLTGQQPYKADSPMQVLFKHMQAPVPNILDINANLPLGLEVVMRRALAKNPEARYQTAIEFAEAFTEAIHRRDDSLVAAKAKLPLEQPSQGEDPGRTAIFSDTLTGSSADASSPPQTVILQTQSPNTVVLLGGFAIIGVVLVATLLILFGNRGSDTPSSTPRLAATSAERVAVVPSFGKLSFSTSAVPGDTVLLNVKELRPPGDGLLYAAWLLNTTDQSILPLGRLTLDAFGTGALVFIDEQSRILSGWFNAVIITTENALGDTPQGSVFYSGKVPSALTASLREILIEAPPDALPTPTPAPLLDSSYTDFTPDDTSLLSGVLAEALTAQQHSGLAARAPNLGALRTHAEHTINILLGTSDDYTGNGRGENPGRKIGVPFYLDKIEGLLNQATSGPDVPLSVQSEAELIRVCLQNARDWVGEVVALEKELLAATDINAVEAQKARSTELATALIEGFDLNRNGQVEPFEGECGLQQILSYGVVVASMNIVEGPPVEERE